MNCNEEIHDMQNVQEKVGFLIMTFYKPAFNSCQHKMMPHSLQQV